MVQIYALRKNSENQKRFGWGKVTYAEPEEQPVETYYEGEVLVKRYAPRAASGVNLIQMVGRGRR